MLFSQKHKVTEKHVNTCWALQLSRVFIAHINLVVDTSDNAVTYKQLGWMNSKEDLINYRVSECSQQLTM